MFIHTFTLEVFFIVFIYTFPLEVFFVVIGSVVLCSKC